jgi:hypothetical protein
LKSTIACWSAVIAGAAASVGSRCSASAGAAVGNARSGAAVDAGDASVSFGRALVRAAATRVAASSSFGSREAMTREPRLVRPGCASAPWRSATRSSRRTDAGTLGCEEYVRCSVIDQP